MLLEALAEIAETALMLATVLAVQMVALVSIAEPEQMETMVAMAWTAAWQR